MVFSNCSVTPSFLSPKLPPLWFFLHFQFFTFYLFTLVLVPYSFLMVAYIYILKCHRCFLHVIFILLPLGIFRITFLRWLISTFMNFTGLRTENLKIFLPSRSNVCLSIESVLFLLLSRMFCSLFLCYEFLIKLMARYFIFWMKWIFNLYFLSDSFYYKL